MLTLVAMLTAPTLLAADIRSEETVIIASEEIVNDDLYVSANTIIVDGTINGDLFAAANTITINGVVNGNLFAAGSTVTVNGVVNGSVMAAGRTVTINGDIARAVRVAGETVNINGNVNHDVMVGCSEVAIASTAKIDGALFFGAGTAYVDGLIEGNIEGTGSEATLADGVKGDVDLEVDKLTILPTADIQGDLTYTSEQEADIQPGAQIGGVTTHKLPEVKEKPAKTFPFVLFSGIGGNVIGFLMALIAGLVIILVAPKWLTSIVESIRSSPGASAGWGALILFATPIAAIIVCITIVGIPVGLIALALWGIAIYLAQIPVGLFVGRWIIGRFRTVDGKAIMVGALALGLVILSLLKLILYLGFFIGLAIILFGLGAVVVAIRKWRAEARGPAST